MVFIAKHVRALFFGKSRVVLFVVRGAVFTVCGCRVDGCRVDGLFLANSCYVLDRSPTTQSKIRGQCRIQGQILVINLAPIVKLQNSLLLIAIMACKYDMFLCVFAF
jgi:hypothetical protein